MLSTQHTHPHLTHYFKAPFQWGPWPPAYPIDYSCIGLAHIKLPCARFYKNNLVRRGENESVSLQVKDCLMTSLSEYLHVLWRWVNTNYQKVLILVKCWECFSEMRNEYPLLTVLKGHYKLLTSFLSEY